VRVYSERVYGIPPEQVVGTMGDAGKSQGIHLMIGRRPLARLETRPATSRCWNTPGLATACD
jgi:hypothetical protein